jgi:hypothetical protein
MSVNANSSPMDSKILFPATSDIYAVFLKLVQPVGPIGYYLSAVLGIVLRCYFILLDRTRVTKFLILMRLSIPWPNV